MQSSIGDPPNVLPNGLTCPGTDLEGQWNQAIIGSVEG